MAIKRYEEIPVTGPAGLYADNQFRCPVCGHNYVHIRDVAIVQNREVLVIGDKNEIKDRYTVGKMPSQTMPAGLSDEESLRWLRSIAEVPIDGSDADREPIEFEVRGSSIVVGMWCEDGHEFDYIMSFHKGNVLLNVRHTGTSDDDGHYQIELWRD